MQIGKIVWNLVASRDPVVAPDGLKRTFRNYENGPYNTTDHNFQWKIGPRGGTGGTGSEVWAGRGTGSGANERLSGGPGDQGALLRKHSGRVLCILTIRLELLRPPLMNRTPPHPRTPSGTVKLLQNSLEKLPDPAHTTPSGGGQRPPPGRVVMRGVLRYSRGSSEGV